MSGSESAVWMTLTQATRRAAVPLLPGILFIDRDGGGLDRC